MRIGILGPGGVGGLLAALFTRAGAEVVCIATPGTAAAINETGLSVTSERFGSFCVEVAAEPKLQSSIDVLCITVKATDLRESLASVPREILGGAVVVPFLNGIEHLEVLRAHFPDVPIVAATIRVESARVAPGEIVHTSPFAIVELAPRPSERERIGQFADLIQRAGLDVNLRDGENQILWEKLGFLAPLALLTTAHDAPAGAVRTDHREELTAVIAEVVAVAGAVGVVIDPKSVMAQFDGVPETMQSSMQRDARAGRPLEIDAIGGAIVRAATRLAIPIPTLSSLVGQLKRVSEKE